MTIVEALILTRATVVYRNDGMCITKEKKVLREFKVKDQEELMDTFPGAHELMLKKVHELIKRLTKLGWEDYTIRNADTWDPIFDRCGCNAKHLEFDGGEHYIFAIEAI